MDPNFAAAARDHAAGQVATLEAAAERAEAKTARYAERLAEAKTHAKDARAAVKAARAEHDEWAGLAGGAAAPGGDVTVAGAAVAQATGDASGEGEH